MGKKTKAAVDKMIKLTGLEVEQHKKIGALSKGYKQRVGLAQALIHDPDVLIFDEPTSGLDPNQVIEIRNLIKNVGAKKTVMLSTHIMREVEVLCDRVIIINKGKIVADKTIGELQQSVQAKSYTLYVQFDKAIDKNLLLNVDGVKSVMGKESHQWEIIVNSDKDIRSDISRIAFQNEILVISLSREEHSLEEVFQLLTKK